MLDGAQIAVFDEDGLQLGRRRKKRKWAAIDCGRVLIGIPGMAREPPRTDGATLPFWSPDSRQRSVSLPTGA